MKVRPGRCECSSARGCGCQPLGTGGGLYGTLKGRSSERVDALGSACEGCLMIMSINRILLLPAALLIFVCTSFGRAESVSGTVLSASGQPVDGAEVIAAAPGKAAWPNLAAEDRDEKRQG